MPARHRGRNAIGVHDVLHAVHHDGSRLRGRRAVGQRHVAGHAIVRRGLRRTRRRVRGTGRRLPARGAAGQGKLLLKLAGAFRISRAALRLGVAAPGTGRTGVIRRRSLAASSSLLLGRGGLLHRASFVRVRARLHCQPVQNGAGR